MRLVSLTASDKSAKILELLVTKLRLVSCFARFSLSLSRNSVMIWRQVKKRQLMKACRMVA